ncbi:MAG TPA: alginate export family protein [Planctomycetota bacterium]|nr:alginate export family protein [Planctomycetota bacterium]
MPFVLLVALTLVAQAQPAPEQETLLQSAAKRITIGGQARFRAEYRDPVSYVNAPASSKSDDLYLSRLRLNLKVSATDDLDVFIQPQDQRVFGQEASVASDERNLDLHQGFVEFRNLLGEPLSVKLGRQEFLYGDQRLVSSLDWHNVARAWDGARVRYAPKEFWAEAFYTVIKEGNGAAEDQDFYGLYASCQAVPNYEFDLYVFRRQLRDNSFTGELGGVGDLQDTTAGARVKGKAVGFDYTFEGMAQSGHLAKDEIRAYAFAGTFGYTAECPWKPRIGVEYTWASGDRDPTDGKRGTFDPLFPFAHYYQGFADVFAFRNGQDLMVSVRATPVEGVTIQLDGHTYRLVEDKDAWYHPITGAAIRRDATGSADPRVGHELDLHARVTAGKFVKFWAGWSHVFAGPYIRQTAGPDRDMDWFFVQMTVDF